MDRQAENEPKGKDKAKAAGRIFYRLEIIILLIQGQLQHFLFVRCIE
jgi:hypothetical protein